MVIKELSDEIPSKISDEEITAEMKRPNAMRIFVIHEAFRRGWTVEQIFELTSIDRWFLRPMHELAMYEDEISSYESLENLAKDRAMMLQIKEFGYSDRQIAYLLNSTELEVLELRRKLNVIPV